MEKLETYKTLISFLVNNQLVFILFVISFSLYAIFLKLLILRYKKKKISKYLTTLIISILSILFIAISIYSSLPFFSYYFLLRGNRNIKDNNILKAYIEYKIAYRLSSDDPEIKSCLAYSSYYSGRLEEANKLFTELFNDNTLTPDMSILYASLLLNSKRLSLAKKNLDIAISSATDTTMALFYMGTYYELKNNIRLSEKYFKLALSGSKKYRIFILKYFYSFCLKNNKALSKSKIFDELKKGRH